MSPSTITVTGMLSNVVSFLGERSEVLYATLQDLTSPERHPRRLTISGSILDQDPDLFVDGSVVSLVCERRPQDATDRVLRLA